MNREQLLTSIQQGLQMLMALPDPGRGLAPVLRRLRGAAAGLSQPRLRVGVFGITSSGKSALINAFLGEPLLPEQSPPSSNVPVILRAGPSRTLAVHRLTPGAEPEQVPATAASLEALGTIDGNPENRKSIRLLELTLPQTLIPPEIELEDSQGLGAATDRAAETQVRLESLPRADIVLYLLAAGRFSRLDRELLQELHPDQPLICVITGADRHPAGQLDATEQQVHEYRPGTPVVRVNAKLAQQHGAPDWQSSGFPALQAVLEAAIRQAREFRVQATVRMLTEVAETLRSLLGDRLAKARAEYHAEKARHDQVVQAQERLREARADLESEIGRLSLFTPIDHVLEPVHEWLGRLQVPQNGVEPALRTVQSRLSEAPESYRAHVGQSLAALGSKHADLSGLRLATLNLPPVAPPAAPPWPTVTMETRAAFGLLKQKTVMVLMPQLQEALEATVRAAVAPLQAQVTFQLSEWARRVLDARLASWMQTLPDAAARVAAAARPVEQLIAVSSYWEPLGRSAQQAAATAPPRQMPTATAMGDLVGQFRDLALPRLLLRAIHDVSRTGRTGRRRVLLIGKRFDRPWQLVQLLLREQQRDALAPPTGLLWLRTPDRHTPPPFPCDSCPHPEHRLLSRIDLVVAAENADPVELSAAAHWADAVIVAAPASETAEARWAAKEILVLGEAGTQADRLPELMATLAGRRVILHDGHDVRFTHLLSLLGRAETPANLVRLWRAWRLRQGSPFDPADLQGYFAEIQAGRSGDRA